MSGFSNPVTDALGTLVRALMKSVNFIVGVSGWRITRDGDAEFNNGVFRGTVTITAPNGSKIVFDASDPQPTITFYSPDGTNTAFINAPNGGNPAVADLGLNSGVYTPGDGIPRRSRIFMIDSIDIMRIEVIKSSNQATKGGFLFVRSVDGGGGYVDADAGIVNYQIMSATNWQINSAYSNGLRGLPYHLFSYNPFAGPGTVIPATGVETAFVTASGSTVWKAGRVYRCDIRIRWSHGGAGNAALVVRIRKGTTVAGAIWGAQNLVVVPAFVNMNVVQIFFGNYTGADITSQCCLTGQAANAIAITPLAVQDGRAVPQFHVDFFDVGDTTSWTHESAMS